MEVNHPIWYQLVQASPVLTPLQSPTLNPTRTFPRRNPTTVTFNISSPVDFYVNTLPYDSINGGWFGALFVVESEVPSIAADCAALEANDTHVHHTQVRIGLQLVKGAFLEPCEKKKLDERRKG